MARLLFCVRKSKQGVCISHKFEAFLLYCFIHQTQFRVGAGGESGPSKVVGRMPRPLALAMTCLLIMPRTSDRYGVAWLGSAGLGSAGLGKPGLGWARLGFARLGWVVLGCAGLP